MSAVVGQAQAMGPPPGAAAKPYEQATVTLSKQEHVQLVTDAHYWKWQHQRAVVRLQRQQLLYQHALEQIRQHERLAREHEQDRLREAKLREQLVRNVVLAELREARWRGLHAQHLEQLRLREAALRAQLVQEQANNRELRRQLFGRHTEKSHLVSKVAPASQQHKRPRGQQPGARGHGRTRLTQLPVREESIELEAAVCPQCGLALQVFPGTDDCEVVEFEVRAWRRVIHRRRYRPVCQCGCLPSIVTAPAPPRLIPKGKLGVSVWVHLLLGKFLHGQPMHRLLQGWEDQGLHLSPGTVTDGLHKLAALFEPLQHALHEQLRGQSHWHADETRWQVFAEQAGKARPPLVPVGVPHPHGGVLRARPQPLLESAQLRVAGGGQGHPERGPVLGLQEVRRHAPWRVPVVLLGPPEAGFSARGQQPPAAVVLGHGVGRAHR
jgi:transposase